MKEYYNNFENNSSLVELSSVSYLDFTTECAKEVKDISDKLESLSCEFDDKNRIILMSKNQIEELRRTIAVTKKEKREIKREIKATRRSLLVDINFLNKLNKRMSKQRGGAHLIDYQKRKIK